MTKSVYHVEKIDNDTLFGVSLFTGDNFLEVSRKGSKSKVLMNVQEARQLPSHIIANDNINLRTALYHEYENESLYMKDISWSIAKILPAIYPALHRYKVIEQDESSVDKLKKNLTERLKLLNQGESVSRRNASEYILIAKGKRVSHYEYDSTEMEDKTSARLRRFMKRSNIWQSYPNLYPKLRDKLPFFSSSGPRLNPFDVAFRSYNMPTGIPKSMKLFSASLGRNKFNIIFKDHEKHLADGQYPTEWDNSMYSIPLT